MEHRLTAHDRCDRCGARACARTRHEAGDLLWCQHHYNRHEDTLSPSLVFYSVWWSDDKPKEPVRA